ncbi:MAG: efflux RND transporter periplasmic adaptor subunit [Lysobacterales bacterium]|nr:efflux RND transporter periplasmic adaptor subunit [Xanthomonadales bacterium]MCB1612730.1 efflux RND transporter periplasmic adaptor subunit [Xanthomonadales bacterium]
MEACARQRLLLAALGLVATLLGACGGQAPKPPAGAAKPVPVVVQPVTRTDWVDRIEALGTAHANESVTLTAKTAETVARVNFSDGQMVAAGDVLVELTDRTEVAQLKEAQAAFVEAEKQYERLRGLVKQGTVTQSQVDQQLAARDSARARSEAIRVRLSDRVITAPFAGVLGFRMVSPGTLVQPGTVITTLDDIRTIKLDFSIPETFLSALAVGQRIEARSSAYPESSFDGVVTSLDSRVDPISRAIMVRAELPNPERLLKPGMLLSVEVLNRPRVSLTVPEVSVSALRERAFVYRIDEAMTAHEVDVQVGARRSGEVEILDGLSEGDRIVTDGLVRMREGVKVNLVSDAAGTD